MVRSCWSCRSRPAGRYCGSRPGCDEADYLEALGRDAAGLLDLGYNISTEKLAGALADPPSPASLM
ncbi:MAG: hypothetical protein ACOX33_10265 [Dethiobacteria bacterium]